MKNLAWRLEAALLSAALLLLRALGPVRASDLGAAVARGIGPLLPVSRVAHDNLTRAMPHLRAAERRAVVRAVWDNLGRTVAELPHLPALRETASGPGWELAGVEHVVALVEGGGPVILFSAHLGNWEVLPRAAQARGLPIGLFYRAATNPLVDAMLRRLRGQGLAASPSFPKGAEGARGALRHLREGGALGALIDQKMNDGIEARFFGLPAMTAPAVAALALRFGCRPVPVQVQRLGPARLRVVCEAPLPVPATGDRQADIASLTQVMNDRVEAWIRARPGEWLWLHRRWPKPGAPRSE
jgi:KDO2-lipid IV(A) lauroyltransferase